MKIKSDKNSIFFLCYFYVQFISVFVRQNTCICNFGSESWVILSPIEQSIKAKIEAVGTPLKDWDINIYRGVLTGYNEAFIIDVETKEKLITEDPNSAEIIRPILRGKDIKKYDYDFADKWLINILNGFTNKNRGAKEPEKFISGKYPAVYEYFIKKHNEYEAKPATERKKSKGLKDRDDQGEYWWELRACAYSEDLDRQKIVWKRIGSILRFCYDENKHMVLDSTCFAIGNHMKYLVGILNSKLGNYMLQDSPKTGTGDLLVSVQAIEPLKIPIPNTKIEQQIEKLLQEQDYQAIDKLVYEIYQLNKNEVDFIDFQ